MAVFDDEQSTEKVRIYGEFAESGDYESYGDAITLRFGGVAIPHVNIYGGAFEAGVPAFRRVRAPGENTAQRWERQPASSLSSGSSAGVAETAWYAGSPGWLMCDFGDKTSAIQGAS